MRSIYPFLLVGPALFLMAACSEVDGVEDSADATTESPSVAEVASGYQEFKKLTKEPVLVDVTFALDCRAPSKEMIEQFRTMHGPHAQTAIEIYMNEKAAKAFAEGGRAYPVGSAIVKHKSFLTEKPTKAGAGGMVKRSAGFDPENGDWEYFYFDDPKKIASGKLQTCIKCHRGAKTRDYVFGSWGYPLAE